MALILSWKCEKATHARAAVAALFAGERQKVKQIR
jgi:hypothetical protein